MSGSSFRGLNQSKNAISILFLILIAFSLKLFNYTFFKKSSFPSISILTVLLYNIFSNKLSL